MTRHRLVVRPHRPYRSGIVYTVLGALVVAAIAGAFEFGRLRAGFDTSEATRAQEQQASEIQRLTELNRELRERVALLERSSEIDREARERIQRELAEMQDRALGLQEELAFYRGIVSPEDGQAGLRIQNFSISRGPGQEGLLRYRLVLIQAVKHDRRVSGRVDVTVNGVQGGEPRSLPLQELLVGESGELVYSFRYFQDFEGLLRLPEDFSPGTIDIAVRPSGRGGEALQQTVNWADVAG